MLGRAWALLLLLPVALGCGEDVTTPGPDGGGTTSSGGSGGSGGTGGTGGTGGSGANSSGGTGACPQTEPTHTDGCHQPGLTCPYGTTCCVCEDITCAVLWLCADPTDNDPACPSTAPVPTTGCDAELGCYYCVADKPVLMFCTQGQWTEGAMVGCL